MNFTRRNQPRSFVRCLASALLTFMMVGGIGTQVIVWGSAEEETWGQNAHVDVPSYAETLVAKHKGFDECWTEGSGHPLPTGAVLLLDDAIAADYVTDPELVSAAFDTAVAGEPLPKSIESIIGFCA